MIEAWEREYEGQLRREANWVACLMNATGNFKEPVTADALTQSKESKHTIDEEAIRARAEERKRDRLKARKQ